MVQLWSYCGLVTDRRTELVNLNVVHNQDTHHITDLWSRPPFM